MFSMLARGSFSALLVASLWAATIPGLVLAHPGHGNTDPNRPSHYLLSFEHIAPVVAAVVIAAAIALGLRMCRVGVLAK